MREFAPSSFIQDKLSLVELKSDARFLTHTTSYIYLNCLCAVVDLHLQNFFPVEVCCGVRPSDHTQNLIEPGGSTVFRFLHVDRIVVYTQLLVPAIAFGAPDLRVIGAAISKLCVTPVDQNSKRLKPWTEY